MTSIAFDTLQASKILRDAGIGEAQAEAFVKIVQQTADLPDITNLATRQDVESLQSDVEKLRGRLELRFDSCASKTDVNQIESRLETFSTKADIAHLESRLDTFATKTDFAHLEGRLDSFATKTDFNHLEGRLDSFATKTDLAHHESRFDTFASKADLAHLETKLVWVIVGMGAISACANGGFQFLAKLLRL